MTVSGTEYGSILLVEDDDDDLELTLRALAREKLDKSCAVVRDGAEALDYLFARNAYKDRDPGAIPAVVMLDLMLPKISGLDVLRQIRDNEITNLLPVVVLTSSNEDRDVIESYGLGANSYVRKPVDFKEFSAAVSLLGLYWLTRNIRPPT